MLGAVLFALFHYLFAETGTKIIAFIFILIGVILLTGKSFGDFVGKIMMVLVDFSKSQWDAFKTDMTEWKQKSKRKSRKNYTKKTRAGKSRTKSSDKVNYRTTISSGRNQFTRANNFKLR